MPKIIEAPNPQKLMLLPRPVWEGREVTCSGCECKFEVERFDIVQPSIHDNAEGFYTYCAGCGHPIFVKVREIPRIVAAANSPQILKK